MTSCERNDDGEDGKIFGGRNYVEWRGLDTSVLFPPMIMLGRGHTTTNFDIIFEHMKCVCVTSSPIIRSMIEQGVCRMHFQVLFAK